MAAYATGRCPSSSPWTPPGGQPASPGGWPGVWDDGDAVRPARPPAPPPGRPTRLLDALAPADVVGADGPAPIAWRGGRPVEEGDALVVATSGSTGEPKGVVLTHGAVAASARATTGPAGGRPGDRHRWLACLPLAHVGGLARGHPGPVTGTALTVHGGFDADAVAEAAGRRGRPSSPWWPRRSCGWIPALFRTVVLGGAGPPGGLAPNVVTTYGMTETGSGRRLRRRGPSTGSRWPSASAGRARGPGRDPAARPHAAALLPGRQRPRPIPEPTGPGGGWPPATPVAIDARRPAGVVGRRAEMIVTGGEKVGRRRWRTAALPSRRGRGGRGRAARPRVGCAVAAGWSRSTAGAARPWPTCRLSWPANSALLRRPPATDCHGPRSRTALGKLARHRLAGLQSR